MGDLLPYGPDRQLTERLSYWSSLLRDTDERQRKISGHEAVRDLDELFETSGLMGEECVVSGYGTWSESTDAEVVDPEDMVLDFPGVIKLVRKTGNVVARRCVTNGFRFGLFDFDRESPQIAYEFKQAEERDGVIDGLAFDLTPLLHIAHNGLSLLLPVNRVPGYHDDGFPGNSPN